MHNRAEDAVKILLVFHDSGVLYLTHELADRIDEGRERRFWENVGKRCITVELTDEQIRSGLNCRLTP